MCLWMFRRERELGQKRTCLGQRVCPRIPGNYTHTTPLDFIADIANTMVWITLGIFLA